MRRSPRPWWGWRRPSRFVDLLPDRPSGLCDTHGVTGSEEEGAPDLPAGKRQHTETRIVRAALSVMAERGFSATVGEIAAAAGLSARTIYRYFPTHDDLIAAGVLESFAAVGQPIADLPSADDDLDGWIDRVVLESHKRNAATVGAVFWDAANPAPSSSKVIEEARALRRPTRLRRMDHLSSIAWTAAGGTGGPPAAVVTTFALATSAFTFHALAADFGFGPEDTAQFTAAIIKASLTAAVDAQRRRPRST
jgi:AcrR family transcriptional regulator